MKDHQAMSEGEQDLLNQEWLQMIYKMDLYKACYLVKQDLQEIVQIEH